MKKQIIMSMIALGAGIVQAQNTVWTGNAGDNDFNNNTNWWNPVTSNSSCFFRGDDIADHPERTNANITAPITIHRLNFQGSILSNAAYNITGTGGTLTIDANTLTNTAQLIDVFGAVKADQTIAADLVLNTINNANTFHIRTGNGAGLILSGTVSQVPGTGGSAGVGFGLGNGDVEMSGTLAGSGKLWKVRDNGGGAGILKITGTWSGGTLQIAGNTGVLLNNVATNSSTLGGLILQMAGGDLMLGNDEQLADNVNVSFTGTSGTFKLDGHTETLQSFGFQNDTKAVSLDMGDGGVLNLADQNPASGWGTLTVTNWNSGVDHIYVVGGSFSASQLAGIAFSGWEPAGAKVESGELLPTGSNVVATAYETWAAGFGVGAATEDDDDDGLSNIYEYGLGGNPTNGADLGLSSTLAAAGGTLTYIHPQLSDPNSGLDYHLEITEDLVFGTWTNAGYGVAGTNIVVGDFDYVTNEVSTTTKPTQFIKLIIDAL